MSFTRTLRDIQAAFWPTVRDSLGRQIDSRSATRALGEKATTAAKHRLRKPWDRVVYEETIWTLAKQHVLATAAQADIVEAALEWAKEYDDIEEPIAVERNLYKAIQEYEAEQALTSSDE